jgi:hypothetical protein
MTLWYTDLKRIMIFRVKDKLESSGPDDTLTLNEVYKTYQLRFENNKPLGIKEFYTVLKIALPQANQPAELDLESVKLHNIKYKLSKLDYLHFKSNG